MMDNFKMFKEFKNFLWLLKLGAVVNLYFLGRTVFSPLDFADAHVVIPAQILFAVSAYRCLFPVRYKDNVVFHDSVFSSIFVTRMLATFSEVALITQLSYLLRVLNLNDVVWVDVFSWWMVVQVVISQFFVWGTILTGRLKLFFYEELGWGFIYALNTIASAYLYATVDSFGGRELLLLNLIFGAVYLPWQFFHLRALWLDARKQGGDQGPQAKVTGQMLLEGLTRSIRVKNPTSEAKAWGGVMGVIWMAAYWAVLIPVWVYLIARGV